jgi:hypothetical protein
MHFRTLSIALALVLTTLAAVGCTSGTDDSSNPDDTNNPTNAVDEPGGAASTEDALHLRCSLGDRTCYHEYAGHSFRTLRQCALLGTIETGSSFGFICQPEQPSGRYYLWIWSPTCPRGRTWQQCR